MLNKRLPPNWKAEGRDGRGGALLRLSGPNRCSVDVPILVRSELRPSEVGALLSDTGRPFIVISAYLSQRAREMLALGGVGYADATGNVRVVVSKPAIFLEGQGAAQDPERKVRALQSLKGGLAGRVVRALAELDLPLGVRELADKAATSLGTVSRVVSFLEHEALLTRDDKKSIIAVDWSNMLLRWAKDYELTKANEVFTYLEPRGLWSLWPKLRRLNRYAVTGSFAGPAIAPARIAMLYVDDPELAAQTLNLVPAEAGANVWLMRPFDDVVFDRMQRGIVPVVENPAALSVIESAHVSVPMVSAYQEVFTVAWAQAVVDLRSSPGRGPQEAEALIGKMKELKNES